AWRTGWPPSCSSAWGSTLHVCALRSPVDVRPGGRGRRAATTRWQRELQLARRRWVRARSPRRGLSSARWVVAGRGGPAGGEVEPPREVAAELDERGQEVRVGAVG